MTTKLAANLSSILKRINSATPGSIKPRLVAVSKLKPIEDIIELYKAGQFHFGENYIKELEIKSNSDLIAKNCPHIKWHFIGNLQTNKISKLAGLPNLFMAETIDSLDAAIKLDRAWIKAKPNEQKLKIMIQVNTSAENQKNGIRPDDVVELYKSILEKCKNINLTGLMTIGSFEASTNSTEPNNDFKRLVMCKNELLEKLKLDEKNVELSMGMSHDFEAAVKFEIFLLRL